MAVMNTAVVATVYQRQALAIAGLTNSLPNADDRGRLFKRSWPQREAGVMVVFCIVFVVAVGLITLFIHKKLVARKEMKAAHEGT